MRESLNDYIDIAAIFGGAEVFGLLGLFVFFEPFAGLIERFVEVLPVTAVFVDGDDGFAFGVLGLLHPGLCEQRAVFLADTQLFAAGLIYGLKNCVGVLCELNAQKGTGEVNRFS